jgi:hypothetical protein
VPIDIGLLMNMGCQIILGFCGYGMPRDIGLYWGNANENWA